MAQNHMISQFSITVKHYKQSSGMNEMKFKMTLIILVLIFNANTILHLPKSESIFEQILSIWFHGMCREQQKKPYVKKHVLKSEIRII